MDGPPVVALDGRLIVDGLAQQVKHPAKAGIAYGHGNGSPGVGGFRAPLEAVGGGHSHAAYHIVADVLGDLRHNGFLAACHLNGV